MVLNLVMQIVLKASHIVLYNKTENRTYYILYSLAFSITLISLR